MLVLPTGQILLTDFSDDVEIYTPSTGAKPAWTPIVLEVPRVVHAGVSYSIAGLRFNGVSQGAAYGDDIQSATNYPLVRITNVASGHVFYAMTYDHSSMAVSSEQIVSTHFNVSHNQERGASVLELVANGTPSNPIPVVVQ